MYITNIYIYIYIYIVYQDCNKNTKCIVNNICDRGVCKCMKGFIMKKKHGCIKCYYLTTYYMLIYLISIDI